MVGLDTQNVHSGSHSVRLSPNAKNTEEGFGIFTQLDPELLKGKAITISGYAMMQGLSGPGAGVMLKTDRDNWLIFPQSGENKFVAFSKTFQISSNASEAYLFLIVGGKAGTVWVDDLSIRANQYPSATSTQAPKPLTPTNDPYSTRINTPGWQDSAFITPDGKELYFAYMPYTAKDHLNLLLGKITEDSVKVKGPIRKGSYSTIEFETFKSVRKVDGGWGVPTRVYVQGANSFFAAKLSSDGKQLYYVMRDQAAGYGSGDIYVSQLLSNDTWSSPQNLGPNINTDANEETPCVSADGNTLYFARNRGDALGFELMFSKKVNGSWSRAEKMPLPVNQRNPSQTANHQPFISADGKELYFTRIQQIYKTTRNANGSWSAPVTVFPNLPLSGHASLTADNRFIFFLAVKDKESLERENWSIWYSERKKDGSWGEPKLVD